LAVTEQWLYTDVKSKVRIQRLTLPPNFNAGIKETKDHHEDRDEEDEHILGMERLSRAMTISLLAGEGNQPRPHIHGVESGWGIKFWASGDDDASSMSSEEEGLDSPALVREVIEAGFMVNQIYQTEQELSSPSPATPMAGKHLKEGSIPKKIIDVWVGNRWNVDRPWSGPLPLPRQSPMRTLGDALAKSKVKRRKARAICSQASSDRHRNS
jgi:hypothetical protein